MEEESMNFFSSNFTIILSGITDMAMPFRQLANLMMGINVASSILVLLLVIVVITVAAYFIVRKLYIVAMIKNLETEGSSFVRKTKDKKRSPFVTLFRREFLEIFRSSNYSFQYLSMACGAPVMVYFCNRLAVFVGETNIGNGVLPALTMLVMLIFISLIVSFSASSISREGGNFYITKMVPITYLTEVVVKFVLYIAVALLSVTLSFGLLLICKYVEPEMAAIMYGTSVLFAIGETCFSIKLDIKRHSFAVGGDGDLTVGTPATFISMFTGLIIAVAVGIFSMVMSYFIDVKITFLIVLGAAFVLAALSVFWMFFKLNKNYDKIQQR
jgi:ABC-2 type transport system permease protein